MATLPQTTEPVEISPFEDYYTESELARKMRRSKRTLWRWQTAGTGPRRTVIGRMILYKKSSVEEWLARHERRPGRKR